MPPATPLGTAPPDAFAERALDWQAVRALFERQAQTALGRRALVELSPRSKNEALAATDRVRDMARLCERKEGPSLAGVCDPLPPFEAARLFNRPFERDEFAALHSFVVASLRIGQWLWARKAHEPALFGLAQGFPDLSGLKAELERSLDERGEVKDDASPRLAKLRREGRALSNEIEARLKRLIAGASLREMLSDPAPHRRGGRFVLAVKAKLSGRVGGIVHDRSQSGESVFVEPRELVEAQNQRASLHSEEEQELRRILLELSRVVLVEEARVQSAAQRLGELELALISVLFCQRYGARPLGIAGEQGRAPGVLLREARHPLLCERLLQGELPEVVPIDLRLGDEFDLLVITGPNTGGKTLTLKTMGVAALCARRGLPFPCGEGTRIPLYDGIVADIGDEQEIQQNLSTFSSHLSRIGAGLKRAGKNILFLLDELGGGTDPDEGAALSDALLEHLLRLGVPTLATTHLGKLKEFAFRHERAENASVEFDAETLRPRYRLLVGTPGESCALHVAARLGIEGRILEAARARLERKDVEKHELMRKMRGAREAAERVLKDADQRLVDLQKSQDQAEVKLGDLERKRELVEAEAQRGMEERVRAAKDVLARATQLVAQLPAASAQRLRATLEELERELSGAALSERRKEFLRKLDKGDFVYIPRYKQRCLVSKVDRQRGELSVRLGAAALTVTFDEVTWYDSL